MIEEIVSKHPISPEVITIEKEVKFVARGGDIYMFQVPTKAKDYAGLIKAFDMGATKVIHRRGKPIKSFPPLFLEKDGRLVEFKNASQGITTYGNQNRKEYITNDGRKSYITDFAKWDRLVQANELLKTTWNINDFSQIIELRQAIRDFS